MLFDTQYLQANLDKSLRQQALEPKNYLHVKERSLEDPKATPENRKISLPSHKVSAFISHRQGLRSQQQDTADVFTIPCIPALTNLPDVEIAEMLHNAVMALGADVNRQRCAKQCGSTLITSLQLGNRIFTANIGDSKAILLKRGPDENKFTAQALNWEHKPHDPDETIRVQKQGGEIFCAPHEEDPTPRLGGILAMTRALGDSGYTKLKGLIYVPNITVIAVEPNEEAYIIHCCDDVFESILDIAELLQRSRCIADLADMVTGEAYLRGSTDNISMVVVPVIKDPSQAILSFLADGHGNDLAYRTKSGKFYNGADVAQYISGRLKPCLTDAFKGYLQPVSECDTEPESHPNGLYSLISAPQPQ